MNRRKNKAASGVMITLGAVLLIWLALKIAPYIDKGLFFIVQNYSSILLSNPFDIRKTSKSMKTVLITLLIYAMVILYYYATIKNRRPREEYGSARWGNVRAINSAYMQEKEQDRILTQNIRIGNNMYEHKKNLFTLVVGGSGAGKTRNYVTPNILQCSGSMVVFDPKGESVRATGRILEKKGYKVKVLDLINMEKSLRYNPFRYITCENDVQRVATMMFKATGKPGQESHAQDPYWENAAEEVLLAIMLYLYYEAPQDEQNFGMVMDMVRGITKTDDEEDDGNDISPLDMLFLELKVRNPEHPALKYYQDFMGLPNKTLQTIKSTLTAKLSKFNLQELISLTNTDELELDRMGEEKIALFCVTPDMDTSFNFLVSVLYLQAFQRLAYIADKKFNGLLPLPVHFIMDEFANVALPDDFEKIQSVIRSRGVSMSIILQNISQLKALFKDTWESIVGNCDEFLYLGGNEQSTHKYVSELLGKETLDTNTYGKTHGTKGSFSTNDQQTGRELLTPDEVRMLDNRECILFIRGERPVLDKKYNLQKHPLIHETPLAKKKKGKPYVYGEVKEASCEYGLMGYMDPEDVLPAEIASASGSYDILTEEDLCA